MGFETQVPVTCDGKVVGQAHDVIRVNQIRLSRLVMDMSSLEFGDRKFIPVDLVVDGKLVPTRIVAFNQSSTSDCGTLYTMKDVILDVLD